MNCKALRECYNPTRIQPSPPSLYRLYERGYLHTNCLKRDTYFWYHHFNNIGGYSTCYVMYTTRKHNLPDMTFPTNISQKGISATPGSNPNLWIIDYVVVVTTLHPWFIQDSGIYLPSLRWRVIGLCCKKLQQIYPANQFKRIRILFHHESSSEPKSRVKICTRQLKSSWNSQSLTKYSDNIISPSHINHDWLSYSYPCTRVGYPC